MSDKFITVGITTPEIEASSIKEAQMITDLLSSDAIDFFHIRKPEGSLLNYRRIIESIPERFRGRLVTDNYASELKKLGIGGYHLKSSRTVPAEERFEKGELFLTGSSHSLEEVADDAILGMKYSFLSPIFNSISKKGYESNFDINDSRLQKTIENRKIVALGGVTPEYFMALNHSKFVGAALLGYLWRPEFSLSQKIELILKEKYKICFNS